MSTFDLEAFITELRSAAKQEDAVKAVRALMNGADSVSIWYVGFNPDDHVPPHDHQIQAFIGVYDGAEKNHFYLAGDGVLEHKTTKLVEPGDVIAIGPDGIHSVETADDRYCYGIHVYLGPLTRVERSLFDWETGAAEPFTDDAFDRLIRESHA